MSNAFKLAKLHGRGLGLIGASLLASTSACTFVARSADDYRKDTHNLVETRNGDVKECYDVLLQTDEKVSGSVVVNFTVEKKTGKIMNPQIDTAKTTAPAEIGECIIQAIDGLQLDPPDQREGQATLSWEFKVGEPKPS